jgi:hypothetical protein
LGELTGILLGVNNAQSIGHHGKNLRQVVAPIHPVAVVELLEEEVPPPSYIKPWTLD